jgi:hypothetical protein
MGFMFGENVDGDGASAGAGRHWSVGVEGFLKEGGLEAKENTEDSAKTKLVEKTHTVNYTLEAEPRTAVTV